MNQLACEQKKKRRRGPRRPGAPQPFLEAPSTAPATQTGAAAHGDQARQNPFWRLQVLRLPRRPGAAEPFLRRLQVLCLPRKQEL